MASCWRCATRSVTLINSTSSEPELSCRHIAQANYLREARKKEADTVHAHARALRNELLQGMKQREAEMLRLSTRVSKMESSLIPIHQNLDTLLRLQIDPEEESKARLTTSARRRLSDESYESYLSGFLNALPTHWPCQTCPWPRRPLLEG